MVNSTTRAVRCSSVNSRPVQLQLLNTLVGQADEVLRIMRSVGFGDLEITPDLNGIPRVVEGVLHKEL